MPNTAQGPLGVKGWRRGVPASLICSDGFYIRLYSADNNNGWAKQMRDTLQMCVRVATVEMFLLI